jgi:predicted Ser/Thr protein kinase
MEETIERIVGQVGGSKSPLAERIKALMEVHPVYVLKVSDQVSPVFESPLRLFYRPMSSSRCSRHRSRCCTPC